jgi:hypothetical protein
MKPKRRGREVEEASSAKQCFSPGISWNHAQLLGFWTELPLLEFLTVESFLKSFACVVAFAKIMVRLEQVRLPKY